MAASCHSAKEDDWVARERARDEGMLYLYGPNTSGYGFAPAPRSRSSKRSQMEGFPRSRLPDVQDESSLFCSDFSFRKRK